MQKSSKYGFIAGAVLGIIWLCASSIIDASERPTRNGRMAAELTDDQKVPMATDLPMREPGSFLIAQLPGPPTFKPAQKAGDKPAKGESQPKKDVTAEPLEPPKTTAPAAPGIDVSRYGFQETAIKQAISQISGKGGVLHFPSGTWTINAHLTIPGNITVKIDRGALITVGVKAGTGKISIVDEAGPGTISVARGSAQVTGSGTKFGALQSGQYLSSQGQRRQIKQIQDNTHLEVWTPFPEEIADKTYGTSSYLIKGSGTKFDSELEVGDFLYHDADKHIITSISGPETLTVAEYPPRAFSGTPFHYSLRVKISGDLDAGLYQIFSGQGVVKFAPGAVTSVHPEWWGAKGNGQANMAAANSDAIEKALHSVMGNQKAAVVFGNGRYYINRPMVLLPGNSLVGRGMSNTDITLAHHANCHMVEDSRRFVSTPGAIKGIFFNNAVQDAGYDAIHFTHNNKRFVIEKCGFVSYTKHPGGYAIYLNVSGETMVRDNFIYGFPNGIYAYGFDSFYINNQIGPGNGDYAIYLKGHSNIVQGNFLYGDTGCKIGIFTHSNGSTIIGNWIGPFDDGIQIYNWGGLISGNIIGGNRQYGIYSDHGVRDAHITDNKFLNNKGYGLYLQGGCANSLIKNNTFTDNNGGAGNPQMVMEVWVPPGQGFDEPLVEDNVGVDLQCAYPTLAPNGTPNIRLSRRWKTANAQPTAITDFPGGCRGKEILVVFGDAQTTLKFSGPSRLRGHGGADWRPAAGDHLRALKGDDGYWYCECFSNVPKDH